MRTPHPFLKRYLTVNIRKDRARNLLKVQVQNLDLSQVIFFKILKGSGFRVIRLDRCRRIPMQTEAAKPAPCTLHPAPCTLHPAPCTLRFLCLCVSTLKPFHADRGSKLCTLHPEVFVSGFCGF
jgi:hypothetical protein